MASSSSSSSLSLSFPSSSLSRNWEHDVFPSFHGPDVRKTFLSHVLKEFRSKGINLFIDNEITRGESIGPELIRAIRGSKIAIVLLSKNYASSSWCLDELVEIMKKELDQKVVTIFYEVDPTDVKKQTGNFGKAFKKTCKGKAKEKIETWRKALKDVSTIAGYHSSNWVDEATMIENIANDISKMLNHLTPSRDFDHLIGMEAHMERMIPLLRFDLDKEVRMIGIWGPPGIGKTTIAKFLFNIVSNSFHNSAIMLNIKRSYPRPCLDEHKLQLQSQMLSQMINQKDIEIVHLGVAQERLRENKVFLVLDDVDQKAQLDALAKNVQWFGLGSRIIITTQDLRLLKAHGISHVYKVNFPSNDEALQMFSMYTFDQKTPKDGFAELAREITYLVGQLPLGLMVMGSHFRGFPKEEWSMEVEKLRANLDGDIESILKFSYNALCHEDKDLFLHIACLFNNQTMKKVEAYLAESFKDVRKRLHDLADKSLLTIDDWGYIQMHELLVQLGKEIVRKQSIHEPGQRRFLVHDKDTCQVLTDYTAITTRVIGIDYRDSDELNITEKAFERMSNLQFLRVGCYYLHQNIISSSRGPLYYIFPKIRLLHWSEAPITSLPIISNLEFLVELRMDNSKLEKLWDGIKLLQNLKWMNLANSINLKELPNLSKATSLKKLNLSGCSSLVELPSSIGNATNLLKLDLHGCSSLVEIPSSIGNATNLLKLNLSGCSSLVEIPSSIGNAINLLKLDLSGCSSLVEIPSSIGNATNLEDLDLSGCSSLVEIPSSIGNATNLEDLDLSGCSNLVEIPSSIWNAINLLKLDLSGCLSLVEIPSSIGNLHQLMYLYLRGCSKLKTLPININMESLDSLYLTNCWSLESFPEISTNIRRLNLIGTSIKEVPLSISSWSRLNELHVSYSENLKEFLFIHNCIKMLHLTNTEIQELPNLSKATNLEYLDLSGCSSLVEIPSSIGNAINLLKLDLSGCTSLVELPSSIGNATNLLILDLRRCSSLVEIPSSIGNATNLLELNLSGCSSLVKIPYLIGNATNLLELNLSGCSSLVKIPYSIGNATNLKELDLHGCTSLVEIHSSIGNATNLLKLNLHECSSLVEIPSSIGNLHKLKYLYLKGCSKLKTLPININMESLDSLDLRDCWSLESFPEISTNIRDLNLIGTSIKEVPLSISSWSRLNELHVSYSENLKEFLFIHNCIKKLHLTNTEIQELPNLSKATNLEDLDLSGCSSLVEIPSSIGNATNLLILNLYGCSSLVEIPSSIGNLHKLKDLDLRGCSKLKTLPININMESLDSLYLTNCWSLESFPEISTNIRRLNLIGTSIKEVPLSISSWSRLNKLHVSYSENLKEMPYIHNWIKELHLTNTEIQELGPWVRGCSHLKKLVLKGMQNLVSLPQLPDSLSFLDAENCESLEKLDCTFCNPHITLNFGNCFKLNQEARDLIIQTSTLEFAVLPGGEVPACFTYRASGSSVKVKLNENPLLTSTKFKSCILFVNKCGETGFRDMAQIYVSSCTSKQIALTDRIVRPIFTEHLYIFDFEAKELTSTELVFKFDSIYYYWASKSWEIKECGILQLLEHHVD